jgi:uncharacterized membrane protein YedE/YeeE
MFTPFPAALGGLIMHLSTSTLLLSTSSILGASSLLTPPNAITAGILLSALITGPFLPPSYPSDETPLAPHLLAGLLVGVGTKLAGGCTSGHMLCGVPRLSPRSLVATATFFPVAVATTYLLDTAPECPGDSGCTQMESVSEEEMLLQASLVAFAAVGAVMVKRFQLGETTARVYAGFWFGVGLLMSGMASPGKSLGFLGMFADGGRRWDPSLMLVAVFSVGLNLLVWQRSGVGRKGGPWMGGAWKLPVGEVDARLVVGAAVFGAGWGLTGVCPGPGLLAGVLGGWRGIGWVAAFLAGRGAVVKLL